MQKTNFTIKNVRRLEIISFFLFAQCGTEKSMDISEAHNFSFISDAENLCSYIHKGQIPGSWLQ